MTSRVPADLPADPFGDLAAFAALPRLTGLALSPDGGRLVATVSQPDADGARYTAALWEIPLAGGDPVRLTRSAQGESAPVFAADGALLFTSTRPEPGHDRDEAVDGAALWSLGRTGEPVVLARRAGGLAAPVPARDRGAVVVVGSRLTHTPRDGDDAERRRTRAARGVSAILHTGMPIRHWDHELGVESPRLLLVDPAGGEPRDLTPDATTELVEAGYSITADGATVVTSWRRRGARGHDIEGFALIDTATGARTVHDPSPGDDHVGPRVSPDGRHIAVGSQRIAGFDTPASLRVDVVADDGSRVATADLGDLWPAEWVWSPDAATLFVAGDLHGRGAVVAVDPTTGAVRGRLVADAAYSNLLPAPDGGTLYALRSAPDSVPTPVRLDVGLTDQQPVVLPSPAPTPALPGRLVELDVAVGEVSVHGWLVLPEGADENAPAPVMTWIHGGPLSSWNAWSWRWTPWVMAARGWAVVLPDPALSTGYGQSAIDRAWPHRAAIVWRESEAVLDHALRRPELDASRTALLGASFGGYMTNWIAGHTDRFAAIVTHAGLWALDQQHATTDAADYKTGVFGQVAEHPGWYAENSPHQFADEITTPMLIVHGNRDYRVPVSEALRLWWDLVRRWDGDPAELPHRFLQLTGENHWVLSPANAEIWYDVLLGFCGQHVLGRPWEASPLL
ncbi:Dipeptidyl aminopeptidase/acylaminoacyl peptidase [Jatrophihabitans endophyticus]|uniref:Dipeptidyl aminopeptidase/acylaminoacyl peptidase n=1 Tax=Jatrophihabitans endophyticus TaxID=1206085 RepID=A0A1M5CB32_9ACTN|nr:prolyl oligopeptidase family serine peptidase [Jatrophihabitans endophyticus]SHF51948.1 Dipeptidyl aminopeptidase/acylaminoacyl peptidase [Jatrophihabitans endophyticus]